VAQASCSPAATGVSATAETFGLEKRTAVDLIEVRWPSGVVDTVTGIGVNKIVTIKEGKGLIEQKDFARIKKSIARNVP